jgi:V/A-type H+-transporting ATPase subunit I
MFPDLGHGLILAVAGWLLRRYRREALILVPCGLAAAAFGLLFGEVFGLQGVLPSPFGTLMEQPLPILVATLVLGVCIVLLGLVLSGIEAHWRGELPRWVLEEAPILLLYLSVALGVIWPHAWYAAMAALTWYLVGAAVLCWGRRTACFAGRVGALLESAFQLGLATVSFLRVGAFAIAHAAFSGMVGQLVAHIESPAMAVLVFVVAHLAIVVVEGVVVMIQTTRLVLLEFFMRFLRFGGRIYTPLAEPAESTLD